MNDFKVLSAGGFVGVLMLLVYACGGQNGRENQDGPSLAEREEYSLGEPVMLFDTLVHDFGTIIEGERVVCYFDYTNTGDGDLLIIGVEATCGCTIPNWSREPLKPGAKGTLELIFDASGRSGEQRKLVTVRSNARDQLVNLTIRAKVISSVS
jgi:hypothetical protein